MCDMIKCIMLPLHNASDLGLSLRLIESAGFELSKLTELLIQEVQ